MNSQNLKVRASAVGGIMPAKNARSPFTATQLDKLIELYNWQFHSRREEIKSKFIDKGNECEENSIDLISRLHKRFYVKNTERKENEYVSGEWDLHLKEGETIIETIDTKTSFSLNTFMKAKAKPLDSDYEYQGMIYMALTGAKKHTVAYCLVNGTATIINDEKRRLQWKYGVIDIDNTTNEKFLQQCRQIEVNHIFDLPQFVKDNTGFPFHSDLDKWSFDIPMEKRLHTFTFDRNDEVIASIYARVRECRNYLEVNKF